MVCLVSGDALEAAVTDVHGEAVVDHPPDDVVGAARLYCECVAEEPGVFPDICVDPVLSSLGDRRDQVNGPVERQFDVSRRQGLIGVLGVDTGHCQVSRSGMLLTPRAPSTAVEGA